MAHPIFKHNDYSNHEKKAKKVINYRPGWTPAEIDLGPIDELLTEASQNSMKQTAPHLIYQTMIKAGGFLDWLGELKAKVERYKEEKEGEYKNKFARKGIELGKNVADGERKARDDDEVLEKRNQRSAARAYLELLENKYDSVEKIYYAYKARYERIERDKSRASDGEY